MSAGRRGLAVLVLLALVATGLATADPASAAVLVGSSSELVFSGPISVTAPSQSLTVTNTDTASHTLSGATVGSPFTVSGLSTPVTLTAGQSATLTVGFAPTAAGVLSSSVVVSSDGGSLTVPVYGLAAKGLGGTNEPTLDQVVRTLGHPVNVGGDTLTLPTGTAPIGEEVSAPLFRQAGSAPVVLTPVARYSPDEALPFGWYTHGGSAVVNQVGSIDAGQYQQLNPTFTGSPSFTPGAGAFGLYVRTAALGYDIYSEDSLNSGPAAHPIRAFPLRDRTGATIPQSYLISVEDANGTDHQDYVFTITGVNAVVPTSVAKIAFTTSGTTPPSGYTADTGVAYDTGVGRGWVSPTTGAPLSMTLNTRLRTGVADPRRAGVMIMQGSGASSQPNTGAFELAVPNGSYRVTASFGDQTQYDSTDSATAEGGTLISGFVPSSTAKFRNGIADVTVADGRLTIAPTGTNTKINFVDVDTVPAAGPPDTTPPTITASASGSTVTLTSADNVGVASTTYTLDGGARTNYTGPFVVTGPGSHTVVGRAVDTSGNTTDSAPLTFTVAAGTGRLTVAGLDGAPFPDRLVMSRIQFPETGANNFPAPPDGSGKCCIPANVVHDSSTVRLTNSGTGTLTVTSLQVTTNSTAFQVVSPPALPATLAAGASLDVTVKFVYKGSVKLQTGELTIGTDDPSGSSRVVQLAGIWQKYSEQGVEATLVDIVKAFGYTTSIVGAGQNINSKGLVRPVGDEVLSQYWLRSDSTVPITVRQLAAYHTQGDTAQISWFPKTSTSTNNGKLVHMGVDAQTIFPRLNGTTTGALATTTWTPTATTSFGIRVATEASVDSLNGQQVDTDQGCAGPCGHHMRFYPAYDRAGVLMPNTWLVTMDYLGKNYDFQDNIYLVTGMRPENPADDPSGTAVLPGAAGTSLDFAAPVAGTLPDATGQGTGFTQIQRNKNDTTTGSVSSQPANLTLSGGALAVTTTIGSNGGTDNTLANGLSLPFDAGAEVSTVTAQLRAPFTDINAGAEQAGVQFGPGQDDFAKVALIASGGQRKVQLYGEVASVGTQAGLSVAIPATAATVDLYLVLDPVTATARGYYRVDGGALVQVTGTVTVPTAAAARWFTRQARAGIIATCKSGAAFTASYESFAIVPGDPSAPDGQVVTRVDAGSTTAYTDTLGRVWASDAGTFTPSTTPAEGATTTPTAIANTDDDPLYATYRGNVGSLTPRTFSYALPMADLAHARVRLLFTDRVAAHKVATRVFSISAEGVTYRPNMDIVASAGAANSAVTLTLPALAVSGGTLDLSFTASVDYPSISGIEVFDQDTPAVAPAPDPPTSVTAVQDSAGPVTVSWVPAHPSDAGVGFYVYRSTTTPVVITGTPQSGATALTGTTWSDGTAASATTYYYAVVATKAGALSAATTSGPVTTRAGPDTTPPPVPSGVGVTVSAGGDSTTVTWNPSTATDLASYAVYRSTTSTVSTTGSPLTGAGGTVSTSFTDTTVAPGTSYWYSVTATDTTGNTSAGSTPVRADVPAPSGPVSIHVDFTTGTGPLASGYLRDSGQAFALRTRTDQGNRTLSYGWVVAGTHDGLDLTPNTRSVTSGANTTDQRLLTFVHAQFPAETATGSAVTTPGAWEVAVPNGDYTVTVSVGDPRTQYDSAHTSSIEGQNGMARFTPTSARRQLAATRVVHVADGRLTISPTGGTNTKFDYVDIDTFSTSPAQPRVDTASPADAAVDVSTTASVTTELALTSGGGLQASTVTPSNVKLTRVEDGSAVPVNVNTSGGGDDIVLTPQAPLGTETLYRFDVLSGVLDTSGTAIQPWSSTFTTGDGSAALGLTGVAFTQSATTATGQSFTSVVVGPDHRLYAGTLSGSIHRFDIAANGDLGADTVIDTVRALNGGVDRTVIGMAFAPGSTADNLELWVTDNAPYLGVDNVADWQGKVDRLTGADLANGVTMIVGLPRSTRDHETNSAAFGPDGALYLTQGSNTAMGAPDAAWGNREEHTLSASVLRLDLSLLPITLPLDVQTEEGGTYDPRPTTAPLRLYATGVRNAFDLVWHSNGNLYVPTNGSAAGGYAPSTPTTLPASCQTRTDVATGGAYTGPVVKGISSNSQAETDWVFNVQSGGYYGHPDPARCEWVLNGGNPTSSADVNEMRNYTTGTQPDRNYRTADAYDAGLHASADGAIEYHGAAFGGVLEGKLLVVRYSAGQDIMVLDPSGAGGAISGRALGVTGLTGFNAPLDLTEDGTTGTLYVTELGGQRITRLTPAATS